MARKVDAVTLGVVMFYIYVTGIPYGVVRSDAKALSETEEALEFAQRSGDQTTLSVARSARGIALAYREPPECEVGVSLLSEVREAIVRERFSHPMMPFVDIETARAKARSGDLDGAIEIARPNVTVRPGEMGVFRPAVTVLVESLLRRGSDADIDEAEEVVARLAAFSAKSDYVVYDVVLLRLRALLARAGGDESAYRELVDRYRAMAKSFGYEGHIALAAAM
jgi:adenylate cyclase